MDNSVESAIEKIKLLEQDKEAKLREKRELESTISSLNRTIRDITSQTEKLQQEQVELVHKTNSLRAQLDLEKIRRDALNIQLDASRKEFEELRSKSDQGISEVWKLRSSLCSAVQEVSDECDIWALLMKPIHSEPIVETMKKSANTTNLSINEDRLKTALERQDRVTCERDRLLNEPNAGEEFMRIKNALRYSLDMLANLQK